MFECPTIDASAANDDAQARQRAAARQRMRLMRQRRRQGVHDYRVRLLQNAGEVLFRLRLLAANEVGDRARVEAELSDFLDYALSKALKDNRPG